MLQTESRQSPVDEWLLPCAALVRFEPEEGAYYSAATGARAFEAEVRYGFRLGDLGLLIGRGGASEVLALPQVTHLPGAPQGFLGLINLRGNLVPLYELRTLLGLGVRARGEEPKVLVFGQGARAVGVTMDAAPRPLADLRPLSHLPPLPKGVAKHVPAGYMQDEVIWLEFDHEGFFEDVRRGLV